MSAYRLEDGSSLMNFIVLLQDSSDEGDSSEEDEDSEDDEKEETPTPKKVCACLMDILWCSCE